MEDEPQVREIHVIDLINQVSDDKDTKRGFIVIYQFNGQEVLRINQNNLLSIERRREEEAQYNTDSTYFAENVSELFNEALWNGLEENIPKGP